MNVDGIPDCIFVGLWCSYCNITAIPLFDGNETFCGKKLADALGFVCVKYHTLFSSEGSSSASSRSGVAKECCYVPCSLETLSSYCSVPRFLTPEEKARKFDPNDPFSKYQLAAKSRDPTPSVNTTKEETADDIEDDYEAAEPEIVYIETDRGPWLRTSRPYSTTLYVTHMSP